MNHDFLVDLNSIETLSNEIENRSNNMESIINDLINMTNDMDVFFDTPTGKTTKEYLLQYLNEAKRPCHSLENLSHKISFFNKNYQELCNTTKQSVGGNE